jgi:hypothetical protein
MHDLNYLAIVVAGLVPLIVGALWYGPLFGKRWLQLMETTEEEIARDFNPLKTYGGSFLFAIASAFGLAVLLDGFSGPLHGLHAALVGTIAFVIPVTHQSVAFEKRKSGLAVLNIAYNFVALFGQAVLLSVWK